MKIALIIVTNFLGTGVLSMPFAAAQLGYFTFVAILTVVYAAALLSGRAYGLVYRARPSSRAMSDIGREAYGPRGELVVRVVQYVYMCGVIASRGAACLQLSPSARVEELSFLDARRGAVLHAG